MSNNEPTKPDPIEVGRLQYHQPREGEDFVAFQRVISVSIEGCFVDAMPPLLQLTFGPMPFVSNAEQWFKCVWSKALRFKKAGSVVYLLASKKNDSVFYVGATQNFDHVITRLLTSQPLSGPVWTKAMLLHDIDVLTGEDLATAMHTIYKWVMFGVKNGNTSMERKFTAVVRTAEMFNLTVSSHFLPGAKEDPMQLRGAEVNRRIREMGIQLDDRQEEASAPVVTPGDKDVINAKRTCDSHMDSLVSGSSVTPVINRARGGNEVILFSDLIY